MELHFKDGHKKIITSFNKTAKHYVLSFAVKFKFYSNEYLSNSYKKTWQEIQRDAKNNNNMQKLGTA